MLTKNDLPDVMCPHCGREFHKEVEHREPREGDEWRCPHCKKNCTVAAVQVVYRVVVRDTSRWDDAG